MTLRELVEECERQGIPQDAPLVFCQQEVEDPDYMRAVAVRRVHANREMAEIWLSFR